MPVTRRILPLLQLLLLFTIGCASTTLVSAWRAPDVSRVAFKKVLVYAPMKDAAMRRSTEDTLARQIVNAQAVPSYTVLPDANVADREMLREQVVAGGFDGLVVFRVVAVTREAHWVPGAYWGPYYAGPIYDPGYLQVDTVVRVETNIYSTPGEKLVWAAASESVNPGSANKLTKEVANSVAKEMRKEQLIP